ncbi:MAG TPA: tRNA (guanosine(37)-N1)-methyltransferase TrmD [Clostridiales bacterium]|nr:tRNA (guanosine(37)-N1)-methyltransferase TrmD [Clostridiales bacterium]
MKFDVLTLFPDMLSAVLGDSIIGRAQDNGLLELNLVNIRDFSKNKHRKTDDYPFSGGGGMLMTPQPIYDAYMSIAKDKKNKPHTVYLSPQGKVFSQERAKELAQMDEIVLLCGHYEGVDQRVLDMIVDEEISIGDFVLTGGEIPAMAVIDAVSRMIPGVLANEKSYGDESHFDGLLEYPQYTHPQEFMGRKIPEILISGHHKNIEKWKREQALAVTLKKRPDLLDKANLSEEDRRFLAKFDK